MSNYINKEEFIKILHESVYTDENGNSCLRFVACAILNKEKFKANYADIVGFFYEEDEEEYERTGYIKDFDKFFEKVKIYWKHGNAYDYVRLDADVLYVEKAIDFVLYDLKKRKIVFNSPRTNYYFTTNFVKN